MISNNRTTGSPAAATLGAGLGAGSFAALEATKPYIAIGGIAGGMFGYYVTTLRHDAGAIINAGGNVYQLGKLIGIYVPTDGIFESNTADFLPQARVVLDAIVVVLQRARNNNILISGNTSGFFKSRWEQRISERRAQVIADYLWKAGVSEFRENSNQKRILTYVGYGDYFPIGHSYTNQSIRANSRIQITSYPSDYDLRFKPQNMTGQCGSGQYRSACRSGHTSISSCGSSCDSSSDIGRS